MNTKRASNIDVKRINRISTLRCILGCESISQPELAQRLSLSWPTILQNVKELVSMGLVRETGTLESTGGRKARAFAPVRDARLALGVDITPNHIGLVLIDLSGGLIRYERQKQPFEDTPAYYQLLGEAVRTFADAPDCPAEKVLGVGISLPGIVSADGSELTASHALKLRNVSTKRFAQFIDHPCVFVNDANAAGMAELYGQTNRRDTIYLSLSNTVGGAILPSGEIFTGDHMRAGEFGHTTLIPDGKPCYCGKRGCADAYLNARLLTTRTEGNLERFFEGVQAGKNKYNALWEEYLDSLAIEVNNLRMIFDCDVIVGGYVGAHLEEYAGALRRRLSERNTFEPDASYFRTCRYRQEAAAVGAALQWVEAFIAQAEPTA